MIDLLLTGPFAPFTLALAILLGLLGLELALLLAGGSLLGLDADAELDAGLDGLGGPDGDAEMGEAGAASGPAAWLGLADLPFMIWLAAVLMGFGISGLAIQGLADTLARPLPGWMASAPAAALAVLFARGFGRTLARLVPRTETSAQTAGQLARRRGVVTQGTAAPGRPAEVRVTDRHGNVHFLRAEPLGPEEIVQGSEVLVIREPRGDGYRLVALADAP